MSSIPMRASTSAAPAASTERTIPFDYSFAYELTGQPDRTQSRTVRISIEGAFTAVSIGYGVVPRPMPLSFGPAFKTDYPAKPQPPAPAAPPAAPTGLSAATVTSASTTFTAARAAALGRISALSVGPRAATLTRGSFFEAFPGLVRPGRLPSGAIAPVIPSLKPKDRDEEAPETNFKELTLENILLAFRRAVFASPRFLKGAASFDEVFRSGFRVRPDVLDRLLLSDGDVKLDADTLAELFEVVATPPEQVVFLYSLHDEGTGRAFQSEPVLSIAGLGISNGDRPFRQFATPILFAPQTTIRLDVTEKSEFPGQLFIALQGYKILGQPGTPTATRLR